MKDRTAVVTGSSTGIGRAIAIKLAEAGFNLIVHGRTASDELEQTRQLVEACGVSVQAFEFDLLSHGRLDEFVRLATSALPAPLAVWINNAGTDVLTGAISEMDFAAKLEQLWQVDVRATLLLSRQVAEFMTAQEELEHANSVINIGWDQAWQGMSGESGQMFSTVKGAVMSMTGSLAASYAPKVRVNCIAPGWIKTEWGESATAYWQQRAINESLMQRWGKPEDVAELALFLASPRSEFINGQVIACNGGWRPTTALDEAD